MPAHAVGHYEETAVRVGVGEEAVFVACANHSYIGAGGDGELHELVRSCDGQRAVTLKWRVSLQGKMRYVRGDHD
jgi:hypothetical protein